MAGAPDLLLAESYLRYRTILYPIIENRINTRKLGKKVFFLGLALITSAIEETLISDATGSTFFIC